MCMCVHVCACLCMFVHLLRAEDEMCQRGGEQLQRPYGHNNNHNHHHNNSNAATSGVSKVSSKHVERST
jgi:hypothetical protein